MSRHDIETMPALPANKFVNGYPRFMPCLIYGGGIL